jgi:hypothetical protein
MFCDAVGGAAWSIVLGEFAGVAGLGRSNPGETTYEWEDER